MDISKELNSINLDKEDSDRLKGIGSSELYKARELVQLKVDSHLNQLKAVIDEYYNDIKSQLNSEKVDVRYSEDTINGLEQKITEKYALIETLRS
mmetsp:Transcript_108130/g.233009  ORF Transcript_108130/g.233009 Transcript_108130/m.233009 type:complete len:95 (+) Transcript_108130:2162-2446(+)